jgi:hypothetical protein
MDITNFLLSMIPTSVISVGAAAWLTKRLIDHRLAKDLEARKAEMNERLEYEKTKWEGDVKRQVETVLADRAADREYILEARKRLYLAIGPLRFQLLMACRDLSGRVIAHGSDPYDTTITEYYGKSFLYRMLRPLTICQLIERQIAMADFSVDVEAVGLLRFKKGAFAAFTGASLVKGHSAVNWDCQVQHVFFDNLARAANALIVDDTNVAKRCMRFEEFETVLADPKCVKALDPFPQLLRDFSPIKKPLLWLRLVGYACLCNDYINAVGLQIGFEKRTLRCDDLLKSAQDPEFTSSISIYVDRCMAMPKSPL